ncbi:ribosomal protein S3, eukaryotic/archaeal [Kipferlia bialata]|uniref:40S ribosomal protein S3 n=1 Tax=Kipferlia bialata TaxID=797122 RepID=A0A391NJK5_9EUKA|nr:ribosomal protein S3, eukaryotic/archaeal [Kipferlia bialata]|eukprot:g2795.t1
MSSVSISKKRKVVEQGVFYAELNDFLRRELAADGYAGVTVKQTTVRTRIIIRATHYRDVHGENDFRINQLTMLIRKRWQFPENHPVSVYCEKVMDRGLCAEAMCESLRFRLESGFPVRRAAYAIVRFIMESGATGAEVVCSGKLRAQRAKVQKFRDGYIVASGAPGQEMVEVAKRDIQMRLGVIGIKVRIYAPRDKVMPDLVTVIEPKE